MTLAHRNKHTSALGSLISRTRVRSLRTFSILLVLILFTLLLSTYLNLLRYECQRCNLKPFNVNFLDLNNIHWIILFRITSFCLRSVIDSLFRPKSQMNASLWFFEWLSWAMNLNPPIEVTFKKAEISDPNFCDCRSN